MLQSFSKNGTTTNSEYVQVNCDDRDVSKGLQVYVRNSFLRQILPILCGCTINVSFGLMLGWPSPSFPILLAEDSPVPITIDQSAIIAGFLMWGCAAGALPSFTRRLGAKYGMIIAKALILIGWCLMWKVENVVGLFASRFFIGFGYSFGTGQLRMYIQEMCRPALAQTFQKYLVTFVNFGVVVIYVAGSLVGFRTLCSFGCAVSAVFFVFLCIIPQTPMELVRLGKFEDAKKTLQKINVYDDVDKVIAGYKTECLEAAELEELSLMGVLRNRTTRNNLLVLTGLIFTTQYSGAPPCLVYTQMVLAESGLDHSQYFAILYVVVYTLATALGIRCYRTSNRQKILLYSYLGVAVTLLLQVGLLLYANARHWPYASLLVLLLFNVIHTVGLNTVLVNFIVECFPINAKTVVTKFYLVHFSVSALTSTKFFQVLYARFGLYVSFCTCVGVALVGLLVTSCALLVDGLRRRVDVTDCTGAGQNQEDLLDRT